MLPQTHTIRICKMAMTKLASAFILFTTYCCRSMAVELTSNNQHPVVNEFQSVELSCIIKSISTPDPRIEWKKFRGGDTTYVYFQGKISGALENRAELRGTSSLVIHNTTRTDSATYRCEVSAHLDEKKLDELSIELTVQVKPVVPRCSVPQSVPVGKSASLTCVETEGFPLPTYHWYRDNEPLPDNPKSSPKFFNSSYTADPKDGTLKFSEVKKIDAGEYYCVAKNPAGMARCGPQLMEVYDINIAGIVGGVLVVLTVLLLIAIGISCAYKRGYFVSKQQTGKNYKPPAKGDAVDSKQEEEGDFRHKSSFVI
ncbi:junctional adhesion molecule 3B-like [Acipenser ruthenus]|uniref:junctional adhesion molecule 3B-like n=1 Tax=Acipenser ruthenus TaxID=7906 RepID=UPI00145AE702|nr:junctional adhesion molecule 3B-like [Acipenser ruthenus]